MVLRDYQVDAIDDLRASVNAGNKWTVLTLPTGAGKTEVAMQITAQAKKYGRRVVFVCDRRVLVKQTSQRFEDGGIPNWVVMRSNPSDTAPVQVCSTQTLGARGWDKLGKIDLVIIDECHTTYARTILALKKMNVRVIGLTASAFSAGMVHIKGASEDAVSDPDSIRAHRKRGIYDHVVTGATTRELIDTGMLMLPKVMMYEEPDFSAVAVSKGEWSATGVQDAMHTVVGDIVSTWEDQTATRFGGPVKTLFFSPTIKYGKWLVESLRKRGHDVRHVYSEDDNSDRVTNLRDFKEGSCMGLVSVESLCLSDDTEILTRDGWRGIDTISMKDRVANYHPESGVITFGQPEGIVKRNTVEGEQWIGSERDHFMVTGNHRMLVGRKDLKVVRADSLPGKIFRITTSGKASASEVSMPILERSSLSLADRIRANSYNLRKAGMSPEEARRVSIDRINERDGMKYKHPSELSIDECLFIGFWIGDGSVNRLNKGGKAWVFSQSHANEPIIEWFDSLAERLGLDYVRTEVAPKGNLRKGAVTWRFARGTGFGPQKRKGVFSIEPYLEKNGSDLLWGMNQERFSALIYGFWKADGNHTPDLATERHGYRICNTNKKLLDHIQAIAACRGFSTNIRISRHRKGTHNTLYSLWLRKRSKITLGQQSGISSRPAHGERAWCVTTQTGFIVTRRKGRVLVTGNSKGFDAPATECLVIARPYRKSFAGHIQMIGRVMRPAPGKRQPLVIDHVGNWGRFGVRTRDFWSQGWHWGFLEALPDGNGQAVLKKCAGCGGMIPAGFNACPLCGEKFSGNGVIHFDGTIIEMDSSPESLAAIAARFCRDKNVKWYCQDWAQRVRISEHSTVHKTFKGAYYGLTGKWPKGKKWNPMPCPPDLAAVLSENRRKYARNLKGTP